VAPVRPVDQQTILVTGATDGLGRGVAERLAAQGATVLVHGRDDERGAAAIGAIAALTGNDRLEWYRADFARLADVRRLAAEVAARHPRLDALVNNAGVGTTLPGDGERMVSEDGYELRFQVNYLAPYLLTRLLLPAVEAAAISRVVNVSSLGQAPLDFDDVMLEQHYSGHQAYCQSKLAQVLFTIDLSEQVGDGVTVNALHPGTYMPTKMVHAAGVRPVASLEEGIAATTRLVIDPALEAMSGRFFNGQQEARAHAQAYDPDARRRLRQLSDQLTGLDA
jgi:NAD(P)-dependent dehydrogenase (short-subunit alcohol dehydrogenase family)